MADPVTQAFQFFYPLQRTEIRFSEDPQEQSLRDYLDNYDAVTTDLGELTELPTDTQAGLATGMGACYPLFLINWDFPITRDVPATLTEEYLMSVDGEFDFAYRYYYVNKTTLDGIIEHMGRTLMARRADLPNGIAAAPGNPQHLISCSYFKGDKPGMLILAREPYNGPVPLQG